jgi:hypothetical protein
METNIYIDSDKMETHFDVEPIDIGLNVFLYPPTYSFYFREPLFHVRDIIITGYGMTVPPDIDKELSLIVEIKSDSHYYWVCCIPGGMNTVSTLNELGDDRLSKIEIFVTYSTGKITHIVDERIKFSLTLKIKY